jgi:hypothetical protein
MAATPCASSAIQRFMDIAIVQTYIINSTRVFLDERLQQKQTSKAGGSGNANPCFSTTSATVPAAARSLAARQTRRRLAPPSTATR